jgi:hypothetical protein
MMKYLNFDLEAFDHRQSAAADQFNVRVAASPVGEQRHGEAEKVQLPLKVRQSIGALQRRSLTLEEIITLGEKLGEALFPPTVRSFVSASLSRLREDEEGLRIRLKLDTYGLAGLPWEFVYLPLPGVPTKRRGPEGFLALNRRVSLVRYESQPGPLAPVAAGVSPLRLVALLASPEGSDYPELNVEMEQMWIKESIRDLSNLEADFYPDATVDTLLGALVKPTQIFHFSGHGEFKGDMGVAYGSQEGEGAIILLGDNRGPVWFSAQKLAMNLQGSGVRLAVLTACEVGQPDADSAWAGVVTALTHAGIPAVVGMQFRIRDSNALAFSRAFYRALAAGQPIEAAVSDGRFAIFNQGEDNERDWGTPVLYLRAEDGVLFPQADPAQNVDSFNQAKYNIEVGDINQAAVVIGHNNTVQQNVSRPEAWLSSPVDKRKLRDAMIKAFSTDEIEILCSDVQVDLGRDGIDLMVNLDVIGGGSKPIQVLNLIEYLDRRGYLPYLVKAVRQARPGII